MNYPYHSNAAMTSQSNFASILRASATNSNEKSNPAQHRSTSKGKVMPIVAKTDFTLQQQMMGIGRCKDLDEWLVGSGESAETADSKKPVMGLLASQLQSSSLEGADPNRTAKYGGGGGEIETMDMEGSGGKVEADWMFQTFDQQNNPKTNKVSNSKQRGGNEEASSTKKQMLGLDPFMAMEEDEEEGQQLEDLEQGFDDEDDDLMLDGGMHLMGHSSNKLLNPVAAP